MSAGALQMVGNHFTPPHGVDVWRTTVNPLVIRRLPAVKMDSQKSTDDPRYRANTNEPAEGHTT